MRRILLLNFLSFLFISSFGQYHLRPVPFEPPKQMNSYAGVRIRCVSSLSVAQPLYIIDGLISDSSAINYLNPEDILRIDILKGAKATALYGYRAEAGVIIISTKRKKYLVIEDEDSHSLLEGATVKFLSDEKKLHELFLSTDKHGKIVLDSLNNKRNYKAEISCIGYKTKYISITENSDHIVQLQKDYKVLPPITLVSYPVIHCRFICICCSSFLRRDVSKGKISSVSNDFYVYPNPVSRFGTVTIKSTHSFHGEVEIINASGQILQKIKMDSDKPLYQNIVLNNNAPDVYFIRFTDAHLQKLFTQKLIVQ